MYAFNLSHFVLRSFSRPLKESFKNLFFFFKIDVSFCWAYLNFKDIDYSHLNIAVMSQSLFLSFSLQYFHTYNNTIDTIIL